MTSKIKAVFAALIVALGVAMAGAPAQASTGGIVWESVPDWDAKLASVSVQLDRPQDLAFSRALPASLETVQRKIAGDCQPPPPNGSQEHLCLWNGYSYGGTIWRIPVGWLQDSDGINAINGLSFYGSGINNASKGWWNRTYLPVRLYDRDDCQNAGWYRDMSAGQFAVQDTAADADWENRISSVSTIYDAGSYCTNAPGH